MGNSLEKSLKMNSKSDLKIIVQAFKKMNNKQLVALSNEGFTQSDGHQIAYETLHDKKLSPETTSTVFWHNQSHDAFDEEGNLISNLYLHWNGDKEVIKKALLENITAFEIIVPKSDDSAFQIKPTAIENLDPENKKDTLKYLDQLRQLPRDINEEEYIVIHGIIRKSHPKAVIFALQLGVNHLDLEDTTIVLNRIDEIVTVKAGSQMWEEPSYAIGHLLDLMKKFEHPKYNECIESWKKARKGAFREGVAKHIKEDIPTLVKLLKDRMHGVRWASVHSLLKTEEGIKALIKETKDTQQKDRSSIVKMIKSYAEFDEIVEKVAKEKKLI